MFTLQYEYILEIKLIYVNMILTYVNYPFLLISIRSSSLITFIVFRE